MALFRDAAQREARTREHPGEDEAEEGELGDGVDRALPNMVDAQGLVAHIGHGQPPASSGALAGGH